jgi:hypothetical protein
MFSNYLITKLIRFKVFIEILKFKVFNNNRLEQKGFRSGLNPSKNGRLYRI